MTDRQEEREGGREGGGGERERERERERGLGREGSTVLRCYNFFSVLQRVKKRI